MCKVNYILRLKQSINKVEALKAHSWWEGLKQFDLSKKWAFKFNQL